MKRIQAGFTMIELIIVIVILGILAAVAIPQYIDLKTDAAKAAVAGVAGAISSGMAVNYAGRTVSIANGAAVTTCANGANVLQGGVLPSPAASGGTYAINPGITATPVGVGTECTLEFTPTGSATAVSAKFTAIGIL